MRGRGKIALRLDQMTDVFLGESYFNDRLIVNAGEGY